MKGMPARDEKRGQVGLQGVRRERRQREGRTVLAHAVDRRLDDGALDLVDDGLGRGRRGRVRAHAARVGARVALADALVVLRRRERERRVAVREGEDRQLLAREELLDDDLLARGAKLPADHDVVQAGERLGLGRGDDDALAGGEARGLEDDVVLDALDVLDGGGVVLEVAVLGGRDGVARHEVLREGLGALHGGRTDVRTEDGDADCARTRGGVSS